MPKRKEPSIKLSPKHGVNPCIPICFWCGNERNEVVMLGKLGKDDPEAPMHAVLDYEPCEECKKNMEKGITLVGVSPNTPPDERPAITEDEGTDLYPTGRWVVLTEDGIRHLFRRKEDQEQVIEAKSVFVDDEIVKHLIEKGEESENEKNLTN